MKMLLRAMDQNVRGKGGEELEGLWHLEVLSTEPPVKREGTPLDGFVIEQELLPADIKQGDQLTITIERAT